MNIKELLDDSWIDGFGDGFGNLLKNGPPVNFP